VERHPSLLYSTRARQFPADGWALSTLPQTITPLLHHSIIDHRRTAGQPEQIRHPEVAAKLLQQGGELPPVVGLMVEKATLN
jgi:hypothetical protein